MTLADPYPPAVRTLTSDAIARIERRLREGAPSLAIATLAWMRALAGDAPAERYFLHPAAFPMLLLPWWMEASMFGSPSRAFQADIVYSTICGYYAIRMIDDIMDRDAAPDPRVLPALLVLHTEFEQTYHRHLATDDPFWELLRAATYTGAETASRDTGLDGITRSQFIEICAKKTVGVTVPLAAVACRAGRPDASRPWFDLVERFGRWHQMLNDIRDWARDLALGRRTYFLSEAALRSPGAPAVWVLREGIAWGTAELDAWMTDAIDAAAGLGSPPLLAYLEGRKADADREWREVMETLSTLERQLVSRGADSQRGSGSARPGD